VRGLDPSPPGGHRSAVPRATRHRAGSCLAASQRYVRRPRRRGPRGGQVEVSKAGLGCLLPTPNHTVSNLHHRTHTNHLLAPAHGKETNNDDDARSTSRSDLPGFRMRPCPRTAYPAAHGTALALAPAADRTAGAVRASEQTRAGLFALGLIPLVSAGSRRRRWAR
jgi:hypothetical protein